MMRRNIKKILTGLLLSMVVFVSILPFFLHLPKFSSKPIVPVPRKVGKSSEHWEEGKEDSSCAICFFGLPRSFELLVLPSIERNILTPNKRNRCDIYFHYNEVHGETGTYRSGEGGLIDTQNINMMLKESIQRVYKDSSDDNKNRPHLSITSDTIQEFRKSRRQLLKKYRATLDSNGNYLYFPWMAKTYIYPTSIENIVKQWHSIESAWNDMEKHSVLLKKNYTQVAMLRNDVFYATPFDIYNTSRNKRRLNNKKALDGHGHDYEYVGVPNWARFPINDRMIYGSYRGVKIWSTERFQRLESHVRTYEPGYGMHSERFLNHSIFPAIRSLGIRVIENPDICFFRTRADGSAWISDCATINGAARGFRMKNGTLRDTQQLVERIVGKPCRKSQFNRRTIQLHCDNATAPIS